MSRSHLQCVNDELLCFLLIFNVAFRRLRQAKKPPPLTAYSTEGNHMAGGWPFFFMVAEKRIKPGQSLGYSYGKSYWKPILQAERALKDKLDKLQAG